jgi:hypothetical protein
VETANMTLQFAVMPLWGVMCGLLGRRLAVAVATSRHSCLATWLGSMVGTLVAYAIAFCVASPSVINPTLLLVNAAYFVTSFGTLAEALGHVSNLFSRRAAIKGTLACAVFFGALSLVIWVLWWVVIPVLEERARPT